MSKLTEKIKLENVDQDLTKIQTVRLLRELTKNLSCLIKSEKVKNEEKIVINKLFADSLNQAILGVNDCRRLEKG